jgi:lipoic acid synthetase
MAERAPWLVRRIAAGGSGHVQKLLEDMQLQTVCSSASCPNQGECYNAGTATFLILGGICTRNCRFCAVPKGLPRTGVDKGEPVRISSAVVSLGLKHAVITSVTRDDLTDGGASQFASCIREIRKQSNNVAIEVLTPDFRGNTAALSAVLAEGPDVFNHNIETVPRLYSDVRPEAVYQRSLDVLRKAADEKRPWVKSGLMVGLGENEQEVISVFKDLLSAGVKGLTIGQYLRPSPDHHPVEDYIHPDQFKEYASEAYRLGFEKVASGPLVRSSYHAGELFQQNSRT